MTDLNTRLRYLADVLEEAHGYKRKTAYRLIGEACGVSMRYVSNLATNSVRVGERAPVRLELPGVHLLERQYARPLRHRRALAAACRRVM